MKEIVYFGGYKLYDFYPEIEVALKATDGIVTGDPKIFPITQKTDIEGFKFDFNSGLRLDIPVGNFHVTIFDSSSNLIAFDKDVSDVVLVSLEKFFVRWEFILYQNGKEVFTHQFNAENKFVHLAFPPSGMGDRFVLFPYAESFRQKWNCKMSATIEPYLQEILKLYFPEIKCLPTPPPETYATFYPSPTFSLLYLPQSSIQFPMELMGKDIFGVSAKKIVYTPTKPRQILEPYVCIAVQTSGTYKTWLNPNGWNFVVEYLKYLGYRVLCIDKNKIESGKGFTVKMPEGAEDFTGNLPLSERVNLLAYADFFIGLSSGLSWLAWAVDIPVILISGITASWFEFNTPYRIYNKLVCHGCHNDATIPWPEYENCPRHKNTPRAYECSTKISAQQVIDAIDQLLEDKK